MLHRRGRLVETGRQHVLLATAGPLTTLVLVVVGAAGLAAGDEAALGNEGIATGPDYGELILEDQPVAHWRMNHAADAGEFPNAARGRRATALTGRASKPVFVDGPRPARFPRFEADNAAVRVGGGKSGENWIRISDPGNNSELDFDSGQTVTLEAWVLPRSIRDDQQVYLVGKGRTGNSGVAADNQNYALRLRGVDGQCRVSFLFRGRDNRPGNRDDWHRWNSSLGFVPDGDWHHVAVSYTFGEPKSIRGYLDGKSVAGGWDYGGPTTAAPVVDNDEVWIGSSMGGNPGSTLDGMIDEVAIYRHAVEPKRMALRYRAVGPPPKQQDSPPIDVTSLPAAGVAVEIFEELASEASWRSLSDQPSESFEQPAMALNAVPRKYNAKALIVDRPMPHLLRMAARIERPAGEYRLLLRSRDAARLKLDGRVVAQTRSISPNASGHEHVPDLKPVEQPGLRPLPAGDQEQVITVKLDGKPHVVSLETLLGSRGLRPETGELLVAIAGQGEPYCLLAPTSAIELRDDAWHEYVAEQRRWQFEYERRRRREVGSEEAAYWRRRHELARQHWADTPAVDVPAVSNAMPVSNDIDRFIGARLEAAKIEPAPLTDDAAFLRRLTLDTVGLIPSPEEIAAFQRDDPSGRRARAIDRLLADPRGADHCTSYWQDVLAENPGILKPELNNTGPFRIWIYQSLVDNKPLDRFATELVMMEGSRYYGGPAGFAMATQNDAPLAAKAHVLAKAFLGMEMGCARCHDAPNHDVTQQQTFNLAAMLARGPQKLPKTSTVPLAKGARKPAITISLKPGQKIEPHWPFDKLVDEAAIPSGVLRNEKDTRERLATTLTMPANERFAQVIVNRLWKRYLGWGLVEPVDDWENAEVSHPRLLEYLARELATHDYDARHVARLILNSHTYQRHVRDAPASAPVASQRLFASPARRRMTAEQLVDSLLAAAGKSLGAEQLTLDPDGRRPVSTFLNLGVPGRAWQLTSLSNERDRPALALPRAQGLVDLLVSYGWRDARPDPLTERDTTATPLQPLALAHGAVGTRATRLSDDSALTELTVQSKDVEDLVEQMFLRVLSRRPSQTEQARFVEVLSEGFADRVVADVKSDNERNDVRQAVSWSNHLSPEATRIKLELERAARQGEPPTGRLTAEWRERMEDALWALFNSPEFVFVP